MLFVPLWYRAILKIPGGDAAFKGTRVPVVSLIDWIGSGYTLDEYLGNFPLVKLEQAVAALETLRELLHY